MAGKFGGGDWTCGMRTNSGINVLLRVSRVSLDRDGIRASDGEVEHGKRFKSVTTAQRFLESQFEQDEKIRREK